MRSYGIDDIVHCFNPWEQKEYKAIIFDIENNYEIIIMIDYKKKTLDENEWRIELVRSSINIKRLRRKERREKERLARRKMSDKEFVEYVCNTFNY